MVEAGVNRLDGIDSQRLERSVRPVASMGFTTRKLVNWIRKTADRCGLRHRIHPARYGDLRAMRRSCPELPLLARLARGAAS